MWVAVGDSPGAIRILGTDRVPGSREEQDGGTRNNHRLMFGLQVF